MSEENSPLLSTVLNRGRAGHAMVARTPMQHTQKPHKASARVTTTFREPFRRTAARSRSRGRTSSTNTTRIAKKPVRRSRSRNSESNNPSRSRSRSRGVSTRRTHAPSLHNNRSKSRSRATFNMVSAAPKCVMRTPPPSKKDVQVTELTVEHVTARPQLTRTTPDKPSPNLLSMAVDKPQVTTMRSDLSLLSSPTLFKVGGNVQRDENASQTTSTNDQESDFLESCGVAFPPIPIKKSHTANRRLTFSLLDQISWNDEPSETAEGPVSLDAQFTEEGDSVVLEGADATFTPMFAADPAIAVATSPATLVVEDEPVQQEEDNAGPAETGRDAFDASHMFASALEEEDAGQDSELPLFAQRGAEITAINVPVIDPLLAGDTSIQSPLHALIAEKEEDSDVGPPSCAPRFKRSGSFTPVCSKNVQSSIKTPMSSVKLSYTPLSASFASVGLSPSDTCSPLVQSLQKQLVALRCENQQLASEAQQIRSDSHERHVEDMAKFNDKMTKVGAMQGKVAVLESQLASHVQKMRLLETQLSAARSKGVEYRKTIDDLQHKVRQEQSTASESRVECQRLHERVRVMDLLCKSHSQVRQKLEAEKQELVDRLAALRESESEQEEDAQDFFNAQQQIVELTMQLAQARQSLLAAETSRDEAQLEKQSMRARLAQVSSDRDRCYAQVKLLKESTSGQALSALEASLAQQDKLLNAQAKEIEKLLGGTSNVESSLKNEVAPVAPVKVAPAEPEEPQSTPIEEKQSLAQAALNISPRSAATLEWSDATPLCTISRLPESKLDEVTEGVQSHSSVQPSAESRSVVVKPDGLVSRIRAAVSSVCGEARSQITASVDAALPERFDRETIVKGTMVAARNTAAVAKHCGRVLEGQSVKFAYGVLVAWVAVYLVYCVATGQLNGISEWLP